MRFRLKVCCIRSVEEARLAIALGADALGLVSAMPSGPGVIAEAQIATIAAAVAPPVATFLLTSAQDPETIIAQQQRCGANTLQLVDEMAPEAYPILRAALPGVKLVQVIHVTGPESVEEATVVASEVDALLLDSGNPSAAVKELGGTGRVHNWTFSRRIVEEAPVPVFLAGGLHAGNVAEAIAQVQPFGLDVCSGVRTEERLDEAKLRPFIAAMRAVRTGGNA
ncbi:MAG: phosphoribosylanthranilate isomerase [Rhodothermaceae bacterium]|nr:phosphoribosylanthranilate isomerase [Rhodothermaceae bacterium]